MISWKINSVLYTRKSFVLIICWADLCIPGIFIFDLIGMVTHLVWLESREYVNSEGGVGDEAGERE